MIQIIGKVLSRFSINCHNFFENTGFGRQTFRQTAPLRRSTSIAGNAGEKFNRSLTASNTSNVNLFDARQATGARCLSVLNKMKDIRPLRDSLLIAQQFIVGKTGETRCESREGRQILRILICRPSRDSDFL
jgi:hypothetical protein